MMSEKRIEEIAAEVASPASRYLPYWRTAVDFARAIEAECRKVPAGYVPVPVEPTASQLDVAVSFALNVKLCNDYNWSAYMRDVYARMLAAAPKPDPDRKHETVPTMAEPVAQEQVARVSGYYGGRCVIEPINQAMVFSTNTALYLAAEVEHWRKKCLNNYLCINAQDKRIAELEATIEAQRTLYANCIKISHEADELEHKCNRLERQQKVLVEALEEAECVLTDTGCEMTAMKARAALASVKGNAEVTGVTTGENDAT